MSANRNDNEDQMLLRLIAFEEAKMRAAAEAPGLKPEKIAAVTARLIAEKEKILAGFESTPALSLKKKSSLRVWVPVAAAAALILAVGIPYLMRQTAGVDVRLITMRGGVQVNGVAAAVGMPLAKENTIATSAKSLAVVGWGGPATTLIGQNSKVVVGQAEKTDRPRIAMENLQGLVFTRVEKGGADFVVQTPTAVLGVRGTSFQVQVTPDGTTLSVLDGSVETKLNPKFIETLPAAQRAKAAEPVVVNPRQKIVISASQKTAAVSALSEAEVQQLTKLEKLVTLSREKADGARAAAVEKETTILVAEIFAAEANPAANAAPKLTLEDIRKKYGKVSRVNLKTGTSYVGYFVLKGAQMEIITPRGVVRVPTAQLRDVQDLN